MLTSDIIIFVLSNINCNCNVGNELKLPSNTSDFQLNPATEIQNKFSNINSFNYQNIIYT